MEQIRKILIKPGESGFWIAECPSLPGCISQGHSKDEAIQNIKEAIQGHIEVLKQEDRPIPIDNIETITLAI